MERRERRGGWNTKSDPSSQPNTAPLPSAGSDSASPHETRTLAFDSVQLTSIKFGVCGGSAFSRDAVAAAGSVSGTVRGRDLVSIR